MVMEPADPFDGRLLLTFPPDAPPPRVELRLLPPEDPLAPAIMLGMSIVRVGRTSFYCNWELPDTVIRKAGACDHETLKLL